MEEWRKIGEEREGIERIGSQKRGKRPLRRTKALGQCDIEVEKERSASVVPGSRLLSSGLGRVTP